MKDFICNITEACALLNISPQEITRMVTMGKIPKSEGRNKYDLRKIVPAYIAYLKGRNVIAGTSEASGKARKVMAEAELKEMKVAVERSKLVEIEVAEEMVVGPVQLLKGQLNRIGDAIGPACHMQPSDQVRLRANTIVRSLLDELSATFGACKWLSEEAKKKIKGSTATQKH